MREIKFRARDKELNKWIYFTLDELASSQARYFPLENWCQCTGLNDKNGLEIYEGDIVTYQSDKDGDFKKVEVVWLDYSACFWPLGANEVIGNVYENPQLLENKGGETSGKITGSATGQNKQ